MSKAAGVDLTPLIHFWGAQPNNPVALKAAITAANLPSSNFIYDRLVLYKGLIPLTNDAFKIHAGVFLDKPIKDINGTGKSADYGEGWYAAAILTYGPTQGDAAQKAMDNIIKTYFPGGRP